MRRFRFRLASVLRLRSQVERSARRDLAVAMAEVSGLDQQLRCAKQGLVDCADQAARSDSVGQLARALESGLRRHQWRVAQKLRHAERELDRVRDDYRAKARELDTLQNLHDQEREQWRQQALRDEQAELDELSAMARGALAARGPATEDSK